MEMVRLIYARLITNNLLLAIDPKTVLCPMFKAGMCSKGRKCKNSHDVSVEQKKQTNIDIYTDPREKLGKMPDTIITCKNFIEAVEKQ